MKMATKPTIARFDAQIQAICGPVAEALSVLDTIPGVARRTAEMLIAEICTDMTRFPRADHLVVQGSLRSALRDHHQHLLRPRHRGVRAASACFETMEGTAEVREYVASRPGAWPRHRLPARSS
jgi:transposase